MINIGCSLADGFPFHRDWTGATRGTLPALPELPYIDLEFIDGSAQGVSVHAQFAGSTALVPFVFLKYGEDEALFKLSHTLRVEDVAFVHLQDKCFQLIFHGRFLSVLALVLMSAFGVVFNTQLRGCYLRDSAGVPDKSLGA